MAITQLANNITKDTTFPLMSQVSAPNCCGTVILKCGSTYTEQMVHEMPSILINIYLLQASAYVLYESRKLNLSVPQDMESFSVSIEDIPTSCILSVEPNFDDFAIQSHNEMARVFTETEWDEPTEMFPITLLWDDTNIKAGGSGGGSPSPTPTPSEDYRFVIMPTPDATKLKNIVQYIGDTDDTYTSGYFYQCQETSPNVYEWVQINVQPAGGEVDVDIISHDDIDDIFTDMPII